MKSRCKKYAACLAAPLCVLLFLSAFFAIFGIYPFGSYSFAWCDMNQQVIPFTAQLKDVISGQGNLFLNMENAGGMNFWGVFLFFLASPFSFLTAFVQKQDLSLFMNVLVALKLAVCALCAAVYFRYKTPRLSVPLNLLLSCMYAFCGYALLFYQNVMWLDIMYLFPLLLVALDLLLQKNRPVLYIVILTLCVAVNFYLSYMTVICILLFTGVYFCIYRKERDKNAAGSFFVSSFAAGLLSAPCWLPSLLQVFDSARTSDIIKGIADGGFITYIYTVIPLVLCTAVLIPVIAASFRYIKRDRQIRLYFIMLALTVVPLVLEPVNKMWHTGDYMSFPARYAYMTAFFGIAIFAHILEQVYTQPYSLRIKSKPPYFAASVCIVTLLCLAGTVILYKEFENVRAYTKTLWGNSKSFFTLLAAFLLICACYGLLVLLIHKKKLSANAAAITLCMVLLCECTLNCAVYIAAPRHTDTDYRSAMSLEGKIEDNTFYRVKTDQKIFDVNLLGAMGYNTLNHYSSLTAQDYLETMKKMGYSSYWMEVSSVGGSLFTDALFSNKYTVYGRYKKDAVYSAEGFSIVENKYNLPPAVITDTDLSGGQTLSHDIARPFIQEDLFSGLFGKKELFTRYTPKEVTAAQAALAENGNAQIELDNPKVKGLLRYSIAVKERQALYFDCFYKIRPALLEDINHAVSVKVNGRKIETSYPSQKQSGLLYLGTFEEQSVNVEITVKENLQCTSFGVYGLKEAALAGAVQNAKTGEVSVQANTITAKASATEGQYMFFSVPYNGGFTATVNGNKTELYKAFSGFMAVKLHDGTNNVTLQFVPQGFYLGVILAVAGIGVLLVFFVLKRRSSGWLKAGDRLFYGAVLAAGAAVLMAVYILPVIINLLL